MYVAKPHKVSITDGLYSRSPWWASGALERWQELMLEFESHVDQPYKACFQKKERKRNQLLRAPTHSSSVGMRRRYSMRVHVGRKG